MTTTKKRTLDRVEVVKIPESPWNPDAHWIIQVRRAITTYEDGVETDSTFGRVVILPTDDVSGDDPLLQKICDLVYTPDRIKAYKDRIAARDKRAREND